MKVDVPAIALAAATALFGVSIAIAQAPPPPAAQPPFAIPPYKNLKVLPKDIGRADLLANMKFFAQSLGVRCTYCHVGEEGKPLSTYDFVSDKNDHKHTARGMMRLVQHINDDHLLAITGLPDARVTCYTCHRGEKRPATEIPVAAPATPATPATPAAPPVPLPRKPERGS